MRPLQIVLGGVLTALLTGTCTSTTRLTATTPSAATAPSDLIALAPGILTARLDNGLTYYVVKNSAPQKRATVWLTVNAGSVHEADDQRGVAHLIEHMAFNGTKRFPKEKMLKTLESFGMQFGVDLNAHTTFTETTYELTVPPEHVDTALDIVRDITDSIEFDPLEVDRERGVLQEEWRSKQSSDFREAIAMYGALAGDAYSKRIPSDASGIGNVATERVLDFYRTQYQPSRMAIIVVGDVDAKGVVATIRKFFQFTPAAKPSAASVPVTQTKTFATYTEKTLSTNQIKLFWSAPHRAKATLTEFRQHFSHACFANTLKKRIAAEVVTAGAPIVTFQLATDIGVGRGIGGLLITLVPKNGRDLEALAFTISLMKQLQSVGPSASEIDECKEIASQGGAKTSADLAQQLSDRFLTGAFVALSHDAEQELTTRALQDLAPEDVKLGSELGAVNVFLSGPDPSRLLSEKDVNRALKTTAALPNPSSTANAVPTQLLARDDEPRAGQIIAEKHDSQLGLMQWQLANGADVWIKEAPDDGGRTLVSMITPGGLLALAAEDRPFGRIIAEAVLASGAAGLDAKTFQRLLKKQNILIQMTPTANATIIDASAPDAQLELLMQALYVQLVRTTISERGLALLKQMEPLVTTQEKQPASVFYRVRNQLLNRGPHQDAFEIQSFADYKNAQPENTQRFFKTLLGAARHSTFLIVSSLPATQLKPLVERYLGALPAGKPLRSAQPQIQLPTPGLVTIAAGDDEKTLVSISSTTPFTWSPELQADATFFATVLNSRLRAKLREEMSGTYNVSAAVMLQRQSVNHAHAIIEFVCEPRRSRELIAAAQEVLLAIAQNGADADALDAARAAMEQMYTQQLKSPDFWLSVMAADALYGDDMAAQVQPNRFSTRFTNEQLRRSAKRFWNPSSQVILRIDPATLAKPKTD